MTGYVPCRSKHKASLKEFNFHPGFKEFPQIKFKRTWAHSQKSQDTQDTKNNHCSSKAIDRRIKSAKILNNGISRYRI